MIKNFVDTMRNDRKTDLKAIQVIIEYEWVLNVFERLYLQTSFLYNIIFTLTQTTAPLLAYVSQYFGAENIVKVIGSVLLCWY